MKINTLSYIDLQLPDDIDFKNDFDLEKATKFIFNQVNANIEIIDDDGTVIPNDTLKETIAISGYKKIEPDSEKILKEIYSELLNHYDKEAKMSSSEVYINQALIKGNQPMPSPSVIYTVETDLKPMTKEFLKNNINYYELIGSIAATKRLNGIGVYFRNTQEFKKFLSYVEAEKKINISMLPPETIELIDMFLKLKLEAIDGLKLKDTFEDSNSPYAFSRFINHCIFAYNKKAELQRNKYFGVVPYRLNQIISPENLIIMNIEKLASTPVETIRNDLNLIHKGTKRKTTVYTHKQMQSLKEIERTREKMIQSQQDLLNQSGNKDVKSKPFQMTCVTVKDRTKLIKKRIQKMTNVQRSENIYKEIKSTFAKPNRRDPDDFNKQGKTIATKFKPDIHIYIDTSGSISMDNYLASVTNCIILAKKMNVNLYINSFSDYISPQTKLKIKNKSVKQALRAFKNISTAFGGTEYEPVWDYINSSKKRRQEFSIIITDFEYLPPNRQFKHPKNLYYMPCENMNNERMEYYIQNFCEAMETNVHSIKKKILT